MSKIHSLSVIIPIHNSFDILKICIEQVRNNISNYYIESEIIAIDMNSNDGVDIWLKQQEDIKTVTAKGNISLAQAYNFALGLAEGEMILFLNPDIYMPSNTIAKLEEYLYSNDNIAMVGPMMSDVFMDNLQKYKDDLSNMQLLSDIEIFAEKLYRENSSRLNSVISLYDYCLLAKKEAINDVGNFDTNFYANCMEDMDLSIRLIKAGYSIGVASNVFVYNHMIWQFNDLGFDRYSAYCMMDPVFKNKWNFYFFYGMTIREDLLNCIDYNKKQLAILDIGCSLGASFIYIKSKIDEVELCGIELCKETAAIAKYFADVRNENLETISIPEWENKFDYIIMGDIIEHLVDPWNALKQVKTLLNDDGCILASIPNIMNAETIYHILSGKFTYSDSGVLDRTHMRFFTKYEIKKMFDMCGYDVKIIGINYIAATENNQVIREFAKEITSMRTINVNEHELKTLQYLLRAIKRYK